MKNIIVVLLFFLASIPGLSFAQSCNSIDGSQWLLGYWVADDGENITIESWQKISSLTFEGVGESTSAATNERQSGESMRLIEMDNELFYLAKPEQNEFPVAFKLTNCSSTSAVFENPVYDFPKKLHYKLGLDNTMKVTVSGDDGKSFEINFIKRDQPPAAFPLLSSKPMLGSASQSVERLAGCPVEAELQALMLLHNQSRRDGLRCGLGRTRSAPPLRWNCELALAAQDHAQDMAANDFLAHRGSNNAALGARATSAGYRWRNISENIAQGHQTAELVYRSWTDSSAHCENIIDQRYNEFGAAKVGLHWVVILGRPFE